MARILLTTHGSGGDLYPFLALATELTRRGHAVSFAVSSPLVDLVRATGFAVHPLTDDAPLTSSEAIYQSDSSIGSLKRALQDGMLPTLRAKVHDLHRAALDADLLVSAALQLPASFVADSLGLPWVSVALAPLAFPTAAFPPAPMPFAPPPLLRPLVHRMMWRVGSWMLDPIADPAVNLLRRELGLLPRRHMLLTGNLSSTLVAVAVSSAFLTPPADWPETARLTGFCFWDHDEHWAPSADLAAFLADPRPIIALSSGSQAPAVADAFAAFYRTSVAAVLQAGARALVIGAADPTVLGAPHPSVFHLSYAPFSYLYPSCAAVIHHGGIGTAAQALRAGVPMLVSPWGFDQFFIADQLERLGVGIRVDRQRYQHERVARCLLRLLHHEDYRTRSRQIAAHLAREDGVATLSDALEQLLQDR
jgi:UDP:flavonoid glycosyltransferase YjiC (YdhE family)